MEAITAPKGRDPVDPDVEKPDNASREKNVAAPTQAFEWIPHGDASARRRARAHITRGFRRQKAALAQKTAEKVGKGKEKSKISPSHDREDSELEGTVVNVSMVQPYDVTQAYVGYELALQPTLGSGRGDPFACIPVDFGPGTHALLDHFLSGVAPVSFQQDARANFSHVKLLSFEAALSSPPALHVILSAAANDLAVLHGKQDSKDAILHRGIALSGVNKALVKRQAGSKMQDESIAAVALFAGNELLFGDPHTFNTHMDGLASMLETRGGLESLKESKPQLYSIISWFDYSGACNLVSKRRFISPGRTSSLSSSLSSSSSSSSSLFSPPLPDSLTSSFNSLSLDHDGVPPAILFSLPDRYDLRQFISSIFYNLQTLTLLPRSDPSTSPPTHPQSAPPSSAAAITAAVDSELYRSVCLPDQEGNRSRRRHIVQAYQILVLLYYAFICHLVPSPPFGLIQEFCSRIETLLQTHSPGSGAWGSAVSALCESLLVSDGATMTLDVDIERAIDKSTMLNWEEWRDIKRLLLDFFVNDELCEGRLQGLWKRRLGIVVEDDTIP